jgi:hypothetical protein
METKTPLCRSAQHRDKDCTACIAVLVTEWVKGL